MLQLLLQLVLLCAVLRLLNCVRLSGVIVVRYVSYRSLLESRYLTTVSSLPRQVATCLGRLDTVVKYLDSNKSWVPGVGVVSPTASPASVDANPTNATARLTCVPEDTSPEAE